eukprot:3316712-Pleurochrysis_carterae.AAC.2
MRSSNRPNDRRAGCKQLRATHTSPARCQRTHSRSEAAATPRTQAKAREVRAMSSLVASFSGEAASRPQDQIHISACQNAARGSLRAPAAPRAARSSRRSRSTCNKRVGKERTHDACDGLHVE